MTKDDIFYSINIKSEKIPDFIITDDKSTIETMIVKELCFKEIVDLDVFRGGNIFFCIARSCKNKIYHWSQTLDGEVNDALAEYAFDVRIINIKCGSRRLLVLVENGQVFETYVNRDNMKTKFFKVDSLSNEKIIMISCGKYASLALTDDGRVFCSKFSFLYKRHLIFHQIKIDSNDVKIEKISGGYEYFLMLSNKGQIYIFGDGYIRNIRNQRFPTKLVQKTKFIDILAPNFEKFFMSLSSENIFYFWGEYEVANDRHSVLSPKET
jgi:alpha-tubulin suppressor-like RCC1 family protein